MKKAFLMIVVGLLVLVLLSPMIAIARNGGLIKGHGPPRALLPLLPTAVANADPYDVEPGSPIQFSSRGSFHPWSGARLAFSWDFGDGNTSTNETDKVGKNTCEDTAKRTKDTINTYS